MAHAGHGLCSFVFDQLRRPAGEAVQQKTALAKQLRKLSQHQITGYHQFSRAPRLPRSASRTTLRG